MIKRFKELSKKYYYDKNKAEEVIDWIEKLEHVEGEWAGQKFILADFQKDDIIRPVFGLLEYKGGPRLIKECYIEIPKKNGKTTLFAALEDYMLLGDGEPGAQVYNCAGDDQQAELLFNCAKQMLQNDPDLKNVIKVLLTTIRYKNRFIKKLTSKAGTKHGLNAHAVIYDELHVAQDRELYDTLKYAGAQRRESIFFQITTAGTDKTSVCWDRHLYTEAINKGVSDNDQFWGVIYSATKEKSGEFTERAKKIWSEANPIYKYSETFRKNMLKDAHEAKNNITSLNAFKRLRLNIWTGSDIKWISDDDWSNGDKPLIDLDGRICYGGLDLASRSDTASFVIIFPVDDKYYIKPFVFVPERHLDQRDQRNESFFLKWASEGHLIRTPGGTISYKYIKKTIDECRQKYNLVSVGFDPYNAYQYATMSEPTKEFKSLCIDGKIIHAGHPVLSWMADNAMLREDQNDNCMIGKGKISKDKVDGVAAAIMALGETIRFREKESEIYVDTW
jgi:phage terminase large subunit-like protein